MNSIVIKNETGIVLKDGVENAYIDLIEQKTMIEEALLKVEEQLRDAMREKGILSLKTDKLSVTYIQPSIREHFDKKKLRAELPELYDEYISFIDVRDSVRIKVNNDEKKNDKRQGVRV